MRRTGVTRDAGSDPCAWNRVSPEWLGRAGRLWFLFRAAVCACVLITVSPAAFASAEPPEALPASSQAADARWQPAFDYDQDGCYPTPAIGADGAVAEGLEPTGGLAENCHDVADLDNTNTYSRAKCDKGWCAYMYALYFEKDQAVPGIDDPFGHRHDLEHVVVWVNNGRAEYVSTSAHGEYSTKPRAEVPWQDTHPKVVYHKDGATTHAFRLAKDDEQPENDHGEWQFPGLVSWGEFPDGVREKFVEADYGAATLALKDGPFEDDLAKAKPADVPFDPHA